MSEEEKKEKEKQEYKNHLNKYFELKAKYEKTSQKKGEGKKCIQCKKKGGTIFSQKDNRYKALCGAEIPCSLNIELYRGFFANSTNLLEDYSRLLEKSKETIIRLQHNELFHFQTLESVKKTFEDEKAYYETLTNLFTDLEKCIYENPEIESKTIQVIEQCNEAIVEIRTLIQMEDPSMIRLAMKNQIDVLLPLLDEWRRLKYEVVEEEVSTLNKTTEYMREGKLVTEKRRTEQSTLIERPVSLEKGEINLKEDVKVVKWVYQP